MAAHQLHRETVRWEEQGNELVSAAKKLAVLFAKIARFMRYVSCLSLQPLLYVGGDTTTRKKLAKVWEGNIGPFYLHSRKHYRLVATCQFYRLVTTFQQAG